MQLELTSVLALFALLALSTGVFFIAKRLKIPYTILLVLVGLLLVPLVQLPGLHHVFGFLTETALTPELLFYIFLPILIFESAFNMNIRKVVENAWSIGLLAVVGLLISTALIAVALYFILPLVGLNIPFIVALLFGAIISSTDPVAVLALFKDFGAPRRLSLIFEGESLFNDGTAVALFMAVLAVAGAGFHGAGTVIEGAGTFAIMVVGGILLGLVMAAIFSRALRVAKSNEFVSVTLLIISAHIVFILGEAINEFGLLGPHVHISSIIATAVASLFLGNYARHSLSPRTDEYLGKSIEHLAFVANSLVFVLAGILFATIDVDLSQLWLPILVTVVIVAIARIIAVYAVVVPLNALKLEANIPKPWVQLLAWGSLRGALAIIIILLVPSDLKVAGWELPYTPRDLLLALAIGCILATLFVKGLTIAPFIRRHGLNKPPLLDEAHSIDLSIYYLLTKKSRFVVHKTRGFVRDAEYQLLKDRIDRQLQETYEERQKLISKQGLRIFKQSLQLTAIDVEDHFLKELYVNDEVSERVYRKIRGKLTLQRERIELAQEDSIDPSIYRDRRDVFDHLVDKVQSLFDRKAKKSESIIDRLQYYRAQMIIARKALKALDEMQHRYDEPIFEEEVYDQIVKKYEDYRVKSATKMDDIVAKHEEQLSSYLATLAERSMGASGVRAIDFLRDRGIANETSGHEIESRYDFDTVRD